jgi:heptosyltransferase I
VRRILFVKTSSLGDVVHHCPAVSDAARHLPGVEIDWVVEEPFAGIAAMHPSVRHVIPVAVRRWRGELWRPSTWSEMARFRRAVAAQRYDAVVDTQGLLKSALIGACAAGTRHGMDRASAREPLAARLYEVTHAVPRPLHAVERNRRLAAAALGYPLNGPCEYGLVAEGPLPLALGGSYAVFITMTSRADKLWPEAHWVELGRALDMEIVLPWGSVPERERAERIARALSAGAVAAGARARGMVPRRMSLEELGRLLAHAQTVFGLDTGLTHLAAALGAPTVGIYCGSDVVLTGLYGASRARNVGAAGRPPDVRQVLRELS